MRMIVHAGRRRGLLHAQLQPFFLHLEFREVVLPHQLENSFDVCEIHNWIVGTLHPDSRPPLRGTRRPLRSGPDVALMP